jgi:hypothetical protein|nr:MAG: hypothetical protein TU36_07750 [Vulcanisaeta sp. AZ3]
MISNFLRRRWYWVLSILASILLFIISPILFAIVIVIILLVYFIIHKHKNKGNNGAAEVKVKIVRNYNTFNANNLRSSKVCFNVGLGDAIVSIGDRWVSALSLSALDSSLLHEISELAAIVIDGANHYLVVYDNDVNEVFIKVNTIIEMLRSRNIVFRQLSSSEILNEVIFRWAS